MLLTSRFSHAITALHVYYLVFSGMVAVEMMQFIVKTVAFFAILGVATARPQTLKEESVPLDTSRHWAVLIAGSAEWWNYRHQVRNFDAFIDFSF